MRQDLVSACDVLPLGGNKVERAGVNAAHATFFPLGGNKVERAGVNAAHATLFPRASAQPDAHLIPTWPRAALDSGPAWPPSRPAKNVPRAAQCELRGTKPR